MRASAEGSWSGGHPASPPRRSEITAAGTTPQPTCADPRSTTTHVRVPARFTSITYALWNVSRNRLRGWSCAYAQRVSTVLMRRWDTTYRLRGTRSMPPTDRRLDGAGDGRGLALVGRLDAAASGAATRSDSAAAAAMQAVRRIS